MAEISVRRLARGRASSFNSHTKSRRRGVEKESNEEVEDYHYYYYYCSTNSSPISSQSTSQVDSPTFLVPKSRHSQGDEALVATTNSTKSSPSISFNNNDKTHHFHMEKSSRSLQSSSREVEVKGSGNSRVRWRILFFEECRKRSAGVADSLVQAVKKASSSSSSSSSLSCRSNTVPLGEGAKVSTSSSGRIISASSSSKSLSCEWVRQEEVKSAIAHCKQSSSIAAFSS